MRCAVSRPSSWARSIEGTSTMRCQMPRRTRSCAACCERLAGQVPDTLGMGAVAVGDEREGLAVAARPALHRPREARRLERARAGPGCTEVTRLGAAEIECHRHAHRVREVDAEHARAEL